MTKTKRNMSNLLMDDIIYKSDITTFSSSGLTINNRKLLKDILCCQKSPRQVQTDTRWVQTYLDFILKQFGVRKTKTGKVPIWRRGGKNNTSLHLNFGRRCIIEILYEYNVRNN
ncbi:hypothetical protein GOODEAATRI_031563 [Goodea atripinnis]|uniref:Uncharacterized protein n=1 Tax=Goodea atripinnis TaxID=208336 RepID=A0ABV0N5T7_9TELE